MTSALTPQRPCTNERTGGRCRGTACRSQTPRAPVTKKCICSRYGRAEPDSAEGIPPTVPAQRRGPSRLEPHGDADHVAEGHPGYGRPQAVGEQTDGPAELGEPLSCGSGRQRAQGRQGEVARLRKQGPMGLGAPSAGGGPPGSSGSAPPRAARGATPGRPPRVRQPGARGTRGWPQRRTARRPAAGRAGCGPRPRPARARAGGAWPRPVWPGPCPARPPAGR